MDRTGTTGARTARERGSSTVEYSLMVAALAAALVGVIVGAGAIAGEGMSTGCSALRTHLAVPGDCTGAGTPGDAADSDPGPTNDIGVTTDDS